MINEKRETKRTFRRFFFLLIETEDHEPIKRSICTDQDTDEYSAKATRTLYIGNLQSEISYNELRETYSAYGDIIVSFSFYFSLIVENLFVLFSFLKGIGNQTSNSITTSITFCFCSIRRYKKCCQSDESVRTETRSRSFDKSLFNEYFFDVFSLTLFFQLGFGKSQPTNVLWLDDLPATITEVVLRSAIHRLTNLSSEQILDIYIDDRNSHKSQTSQCLIYFTDTRAAQDAINSIRGKKIEGKRIQVDFASKVFVTRFSDIIDAASHKKK